MFNPLAPVLTYLGDTLANFTTGMGTQADKSAGTTWQPVQLTDQDCTNAFQGDWLARKIIRIPAIDSTRAWRAWQAEQAQIELIEAEEKRLGLRSHVTKGIRLARQYGGAVTVMGDGGNSTETPLDPERVGKGGLKYLLTLPRTQVSIEETDWVPGPNYGLPLFYTLTPPNGTQIRIHYSRVVRWIGGEAADEQATTNQGWGESVLGPVRDAVMAAGTSTQAIAALLLEAKVDVVKVKGLLEKVGNQKDRDLLLARFGMAALTKSMHGTLVTDASEEWEQKTISFSQMPELMDRFHQLASGGADIPATRLLSQSPAGLNSTGDSDLRNYYDRLSGEQETEITPALAPLDECLIRSALGARPPEIHYRWNPLWQMTDKEKSEIHTSEATATKTIKETGLIPLPALAAAERNRLVERGMLPGLDQALRDADADKELAPYEEPVELPQPIDPLTGKPRQVATGVPTGTPRQQTAPPRSARAANDAQTAPLYVSRPVVNAAAIIEWAREQGFKTTLPADQLHVTLAYSRRPVDWALVPPETAPLTVTVGNGREDGLPSYRWVTKLGDDGAVVLMFESHQLRARWQELVDAGAQWDFDHFWPHITLSYDAAAYLPDPWALNAYQGPIELGAEQFDVLDTDGDHDANQHPPAREVSTEGGTE